MKLGWVILGLEIAARIAEHRSTFARRLESSP